MEGVAPIPLFLARHPDKAHAFFIPASIVAIIRYVYRPYTNYSRKRLQNIMADYIRVVSESIPIGIGAPVLTTSLLLAMIGYTCRLVMFY